MNPTDLPTAILVAELHITYTMDAQLHTVKVSGSDSPTVTHDIKPITLPQHIQANSATFGWLIFYVPEALLSSSDIHRYDLEIRDIHEAIESTQITIFHEPSTSI